MVEAPNRREPAAPTATGTALVALGLVVAVVVRFTTASPLWLDEALSVNISTLPLGDIPEALRHDGHPPLYYALLHGWTSLFGTGDVAVRALSGVLGVAAVPLAWLAGLRVGGVAVGWATAAVVAFTPFAVRYSTETRMYALVMVLVLCGWLLVRRAVDERAAGVATLAGLGVLTGALLLSHYWGLYLVAATALVLLWWGRRAGGDAWRVALRLVVAMAVGSLAFVPWVPSLLEQAAHTGTPWAPAARPTVVLDQTLTDLAGATRRAETGILAACLLALFAVGLLGRSAPGERGVVVSTRPDPSIAGEAAVAFGTMALGTAVGVVTSTTFASRYAAVVFPLLAVLAGRALTLVPRGVPRVAVSVVLLALAGMGIRGNIADHRTQALDVTAAVAAHGDVDRGDAVLVCPDQLGPALRRTLDGAGLAAMELLAYPALDDGRFVDWYDYAERNDAADPGAVVDAVLERLPAGAGLFVAWSGSYRTFEGDCEAVVAALASTMGPPRFLVADGGEEFFERATLVLFPPADPAP